MGADNSSTWPNSVCWQCGGAAAPDAAYIAVLVTDTARGSGAFGFSVKTRGTRDEVRVPVPRCRACRARNRTSVIAVLLGAAFGAVVVPAVWTRVEPTSGGEHVMIGAGFILGFVVALLGVVLRRRRLGLRSLRDYPPIETLRAGGWQWPGD
jgi:uncharacterized protein (TIGR03382 family)